MMAHYRSELVDYYSPEFHDGFTRGKDRLDPKPPATCDSDARYSSWVEGWLMGDEEYECKEREANGTK